MRLSFNQKQVLLEHYSNVKSAPKPLDFNQYLLMFYNLVSS